ncbi:hypothetical protein [Streptococcus gallolyticus]|uniref:hypothetical protein n=1 Tax=Streptococcus gallolyticus TaxID=315405 RepID=UPI0022844C00|nr:hypothetical protein [Streptococcus gallolyticus]MCY7173655.1 hypothetical protein [Streptococcus gallolyticus subsp. gallolyticus]MCY7175776.1 hypothetical protein [Streptococcus gallolyticus subsp. gallolyticus]MCY7180230.1 hypothetical protein [Streptococcus gallolyticus subsp. gallolyticus]MCY7186389.1 hypothetical protein [Streptococcus gallolyticus subsp. gallolyticus]MCY7190552.1 hypothetical protein [Streptococcus gallolyticus subsp. gallolyticus]
MTIETKMLKPVKDMNFERIGSIVSKYNKLSDLLDGTYINDLILETTNMDDFSVRYTCEDDDLKGNIQTAIEHELENLESQLNILGYTMQDEPKEWQYHVNVLKGEDDE